VPHPVPEPLLDALGFWSWLPLLAAKTLHFAGYAMLTALAQYAAGVRYRPLIAAVMVAHGVGTEVGQCYIPNRTGKVRDVVIDTAGVAAGTLLLRRGSRRADAPPDPG
jgi:VanZ family protein